MRVLFYWIVAVAFSWTFHLSTAPEAHKRKPIYSALISVTVGLAWPVTLPVCAALATAFSMGARSR